MVKKERYTVNRGVRLTETQSKELDKLNATIRDAVIFFIKHNKDEKIILMDKKREIEKELKDKENEIKTLEMELERINDELGIIFDSKENMNIDLFMDAKAIIDAYEKDSIYGKKDISNFIGTDKYNRILENRVNQHGGLNKDLYREQIENYILKTQ